MKSFLQFLNEGNIKAQWVGMCDKVRKDDAGEKFWHDMMNHKEKISEREFLKHVNPKKEILDSGEKWNDWVYERKTADSSFAFYKSLNNIYFIQYAGFEYIWQENKGESNGL